MTDFSDSPSGLDPKTMKPWAEMSDVERLEYRDSVMTRSRNKMQARCVRLEQEAKIAIDRIRRRDTVFVIVLAIIVITAGLSL